MRLIVNGLGPFFAVLSSLIYTYSIWRGKSDSNLTTRVAVATLQSVSFVSIIMAGGDWTLELFSGAFALGGTINCIQVAKKHHDARHGENLSFQRKLHEMVRQVLGSWWETCCLGVVVVSTGLLISGQSATITLCLAITADCAGYTPTLHTTWKNPHSESFWSYVTACLGAITGLVTAFFEATLSLPRLYELYITVVDGLMVVLILPVISLRKEIEQVRQEITYLKDMMRKISA